MHGRGLYPQGKMNGSYAMLAFGWALERHGCLWTFLIPIAPGDSAVQLG